MLWKMRKLNWVKKTEKLNLKAPISSWSTAKPAWGCNNWDIRPRGCQKLTHAVWKNLGFYLFSQKTRRWNYSAVKNFDPGQLRHRQSRWARNKRILKMQLWKKCAKVKKCSGQCFAEIKIFRSFFEKKSPKENWQKRSVHSPNWMVIQWLIQDH